MSLPPDIIRSILLHTSLSDIYVFVASYRLVLSDVWWIQYFYHHVPSRYHFMFPDIDKEYIKGEGRLILKKIENDGSTGFLEKERQLREYDLSILEGYSTNIIFYDSPKGANPTPNKRISTICLEFSDCDGGIVFRRYDQTIHHRLLADYIGVYPFTDCVRITRDILLTGGRNYTRHPLSDISYVELDKYDVLSPMYL